MIVDYAPIIYGFRLSFLLANLYCASEGLGSVVRGSFNKEALSKLLKLKPSQEVLLTQTVGWPE